MDQYIIPRFQHSLGSGQRYGELRPPPLSQPEQQRYGELRPPPLSQPARASSTSTSASLQWPKSSGQPARAGSPLPLRSSGLVQRLRVILSLGVGLVGGKPPPPPSQSSQPEQQQQPASQPEQPVASVASRLRPRGGISLKRTDLTYANAPSTPPTPHLSLTVPNPV